MLQDHPIDLICEQLARAAFRFGQGLMGLATALALVGLMWVATLRPADAAGPHAGLPFAASAVAEGHAGVAPLRLTGSVQAVGGAPASSAGVCRLVFDIEAETPLLASCERASAAPVLPVTVAD